MIGNWITDLDAIKSKYSTWPECDCSVHGGFQDAANSVHQDIVTQLTALK